MRFALTTTAALFVAVISGPADAHQQSLEGSEWGVVGEQGDTARFVSFAGSGRIFGFGGCNKFSGNYEQHDDQLTVSPLATTKMACPEDVMKKEHQFLEMLGKVRGAKVDHTLLLLLDEAGEDIKTLIRRDPD